MFSMLRTRNVDISTPIFSIVSNTRTLFSPPLNKELFPNDLCIMHRNQVGIQVSTDFWKKYLQKKSPIFSKNRPGIFVKI